MQKSVFLKRNEIFKAKVKVFVYFEAKKCFLFVSLQCENNLVEAKWKIGSEKKRKEAKKYNLIVEVNKRNTCETDPISFHVASKRKHFLSETGAP